MARPRQPKDTICPECFTGHCDRCLVAWTSTLRTPFTCVCDHQRRQANLADAPHDFQGNPATQAGVACEQCGLDSRNPIHR